jgi:hypothetical protein
MLDDADEVAAHISVPGRGRPPGLQIAGLGDTFGSGETVWEDLIEDGVFDPGGSPVEWSSHEDGCYRRRIAIRRPFVSQGAESSLTNEKPAEPGMARFRAVPSGKAHHPRRPGKTGLVDRRPEGSGDLWGWDRCGLSIQHTRRSGFWAQRLDPGTICSAPSGTA